MDFRAGIGPRFMSSRPGLAAVALCLAACGPAGSQTWVPPGSEDAGRDGGIDAGSFQQTCFDADGDTFTTCQNDCDDTRADVNPGAKEVKNDRDDDCNGFVDDRIAGLDYDKDGTPFPQDCDDMSALVGPNAVEFPGNSVDDDCDGKVDEPLEGCDTNVAWNTSSATELAKSMDLCAGVVSDSLKSASKEQHYSRSVYGAAFAPRAGKAMVAFSTGRAVDAKDYPGYDQYNGPGEFGVKATHPFYSKPACGGSNPQTPTYDLVEWKLQLKVPQNARSLKYDFSFFTAEYPTFICTQFNDRFIVLMESDSLTAASLPADQCKAAASPRTCNISYDKGGQPVTVNNGFFDICDSKPANGASPAHACGKPASGLAGTVYYQNASHPNGGATGWLTTTAPVTPNSTITLTFFLFDEGDAKYDSSVLIDNFRWDLEAVTAPSTVPNIN